MGKCVQVSLVMLGISWPELWELDCKYKRFQELMRGQVASFGCLSNMDGLPRVRPALATTDERVTAVNNTF